MYNIHMYGFPRSCLPCLHFHQGTVRPRARPGHHWRFCFAIDGNMRAGTWNIAMGKYMEHNPTTHLKFTQ